MFEQGLSQGESLIVACVRKEAVFTCWPSGNIWFHFQVVATCVHDRDYQICKMNTHSQPHSKTLVEAHSRWVTSWRFNSALVQTACKLPGGLAAPGEKPIQEVFHACTHAQKLKYNTHEAPSDRLHYLMITFLLLLENKRSWKDKKGEKGMI